MLGLIKLHSWRLPGVILFIWTCSALMVSAQNTLLYSGYGKERTEVAASLFEKQLDQQNPLEECRSGEEIRNVDSLYFSIEGGIFFSAFELSVLNQNPQFEIRYTLDGTSPKSNSRLYTESILLDTSLFSKKGIYKIPITPPDHYYFPDSAIPQCIVIRAASFDLKGLRRSAVYTHTYVIKETGANHSGLPVLSICADSLDLFDYNTGIFVPGVHWQSDDPYWTGNYYQRGDEWERPIHVEFFESSGFCGFRQNAGLRTHGGNSRRFQQKGMRLYARSEYGNSRFRYPVFFDKPLESYKRLVLKPFAASWSQAGAEDFISCKLVTDTRIDRIAARPVVVYLNGEYWGLYYLQERPDKYYVADNFGANADQVNVIGNWWGHIEEGCNEDFLQMYDYVESNDLSDSLNYSFLNEWMDMENFIDYQLFEIFIANYDWPNNNMKCWQPFSGGKWRWIFMDGDAGLQTYDFDGFGHALKEEEDGGPSGPRATLFLRKLLENEQFAGLFFARLEDLLNNQFSFQNNLFHIAQTKAFLQGETGNMTLRFAIPESDSLWNAKFNQLEAFLENRSCAMIAQVLERFDKTLHVVDCPEDDNGGDDGFPDEPQGHDDDLELLSRTMEIFPNPNSGIFSANIYCTSPTRGTIRITDALGKVLFVGSQDFNQGKNTVEINEPALTNGVFLLTLITPERFITTSFLRIRER